jgi:hypothetical protein
MSKFTAAATRSNTALLLIHHTGKNKSVRGSTVLTASADIVVKLKRDTFGSNKTSSTLTVDSRFSNPPEPLEFELTDDGYKTIATGNAAIKHAPVYDLLPKDPPGLTCDEICNKTGFGRWKVRSALNDLVAHSLVIANGVGIRSEPLRFQRCA